MYRDRAPSQKLLESPWHRAWVWPLFLTLLITGIWLRQRQDLADLRRAHAEILAQKILDDRIWVLSGNPLAAPAIVSRTEPASGVAVGIWTPTVGNGIRYGASTTYVDMQAHLNHSRARALADLICNLLTMLTVAAWLVSAVLWPAVPERGTRIAEWALAISLLGGAAWTMSPARVIVVSAGVDWWQTWVLIGFYLAGAASVFALLVSCVNAFLQTQLRPMACARCRYNLTANTTGKCPECGTEIPPGQRTLIATATPRSSP